MMQVVDTERFLRRMAGQRQREMNLAPEHVRPDLLQSAHAYLSGAAEALVEAGLLDAHSAFDLVSELIGVLAQPLVESGEVTPVHVEAEASERIEAVRRPEDEGLGLLLRQLREAPVLPRSEDHRLLALARSGDRRARHDLIESLIPLAAILGLKLAPERLRPLDAMQEAILVMTWLVDDAGVDDPSEC